MAELLKLALDVFLSFEKLLDELLAGPFQNLRCVHDCLRDASSAGRSVKFIY